MTQTLAAKAQTIVAQLEQIVTKHGPDTLDAVVGRKLSGLEVRAGLLYMAIFDAKRQAGAPVRFEVDHDALDWLRLTRPDSKASDVLRLIDRLGEDEQREALVELVLLHHELTAVEVAAASGAALN